MFTIVERARQAERPDHRWRYPRRISIVLAAELIAQVRLLGANGRGDGDCQIPENERRLLAS